MVHDEALRSALTGQIMSAELARHLESCAACQAELAALKSLEAGLAGIGQVRHDPAWEEALVRRLSARKETLLFRGVAACGWMPVAASTLVVAGLLAAWMALGVRGGGPDNPESSAGPQAGSSLTAAQEGGWGLSSGDDDSTATLLQTCESYGQKVPKSPSEEMEYYLLPRDMGGWDG